MQLTPITAEAVEQFAAAQSPGRQFSGGAHKNLSTSGVQRYHMPADSVSPLSTGRGPAIEMLPEDYMLTASWGRSRAAIAYRARQQQLIAEGRFFEAMQMDIHDARLSFGTKYDDAIEQMLRYSESLPSWQTTRPAQPIVRRK
jgi:filamentous hemagglutinin